MAFQKLFKASQIKQIDNQTIINQHITSEALMERAAGKVFDRLVQEIHPDMPVYIFCGSGNNGGDGLVLARRLHLQGYSVKCVVVQFGAKVSADFAANYQKLIDLEMQPIHFEGQAIDIPERAVIIDAIFGTGLSRPASGVAQKAIEMINQSNASILSIDVPSGLYVDKSNTVGDSIVKADKIYTFQFPKISFYFPENSKYVQNVEVIDIGLDQEVIDRMPTNNYLLTDDIKELLTKRDKYAYKNTFGFATLVGGSRGMIGAMVLASKAALRIGAGLVSAFVPDCGYQILQTTNPEVMCYTDKDSNILTHIQLPEKTTAVGMGMGMGTHPKTKEALREYLKTYRLALLLDADALNILAIDKGLKRDLPDKTIITPHLGEFKRWVGDWQNDAEKLQKQIKLAQDYNLIVALKGAYTSITDGTDLYINPVANDALATAGSGDVLSGIILGLLAQSYTPLQAALLGVYIHSQTAELFVKKHPSYAMIASDMIELIKLKAH